VDIRALADRRRHAVYRRLTRGLLGEGDYAYLHETHGLPRDLVTELVVSLEALTAAT